MFIGLTIVANALQKRKKKSAKLFFFFLRNKSAKLKVGWMDWYAKKCLFENFKLTHYILSHSTTADRSTFTMLTGMKWAGKT